MSTILKALRRLEDQKRQDPARPLRDEVVLTPARSSARTSLLRALVAGVVLAISGVGLIYSLRPASEPIEASAPEPLPPVAAAPPAAEPALAPTRIMVAAPAPGRAAQVVVPPAPPDFEIVRPDPNASARPIAPRPLPTIAEEEVLADQPSPSAPRILPREAAPEYVDEPLEAAPAPRMAARGPEVRVAKTLWHPDADRRLAWIEVSGQTALREVREGERVGPYLVLEIEPTAVVLADGKVEIRKEVGP